MALVGIRIGAVSSSTVLVAALLLAIVCCAIECTEGAGGDTKMVDKQLNKEYKLHESDNFDAFMKELGVGFITRTVGNAVSPIIKLVKNGDEYNLISDSTFKHVELKFVPGVEFDQETPDGRQVKAKITIDGNMMHEVQDQGSDKETVIDREFTDEFVTMTMHTKGVHAKRVYKLHNA